MSIFGAMRTSVSGMNAQSTRLSTLSDNIANADTIGYKAASAQFKTMLITGGLAQYASGAVDTRIRYGISQQGALVATSSSTDLGIQGGGYFVVADANGKPHLTREGSFRQDADGYLVNAGGFRLMGVSAGASDAVGFSGLTQLKVNASGLMASPTKSGIFSANLAANADPVAAANLPSSNSASASWTSKSSLVVYDNLGSKVTLDVYFTKTGANSWETAVYDQSASSSGGFPYSSGPIVTENLQFDGTTGAITSPAGKTLDLSVPNGQTLKLDIGGMTQLGAPYSVNSASVDGNAPSPFSRISIDADGSVYAVYQNGARAKEGEIRLATTPSPDNLEPLSGNVYDVSSLSGEAVVGSPGVGAFGSLVSSALESSTVDIAAELTDMIETQRAYSANSKAFQVATDMADILVNLKV
ncbi:MAG TPA: flagellar hook protein FlgE [Rhodoblastus sp.]|nr:flagellar hook protein FlgE [Rhodoblastus sp.]